MELTNGKTNMLAYQLLARLNLLVFAGRLNGEYEFIGTDEQWSKIPQEEERILNLWKTI